MRLVVGPADGHAACDGTDLAGYRAIRNSRFEASRTAKLLSVALPGMSASVTALTAVMGAQRGIAIVQQQPAGDVVVVTRRKVRSWPERQPIVPPDDRIAAIYRVARRSDTWTT